MFRRSCLDLRLCVYRTACLIYVHCSLLAALRASCVNTAFGAVARGIRALSTRGSLPAALPPERLAEVEREP